MAVKRQSWIFTLVQEPDEAFSGTEMNLSSPPLSQAEFSNLILRLSITGPVNKSYRRKSCGKPVGQAGAPANPQQISSS